MKGTSQNWQRIYHYKKRTRMIFQMLLVNLITYHFDNIDISLLPQDQLLDEDPDESVVDTDGIMDFHDNITKKDETYRKVKHHNILSHKEIKSLTLFFTKQSPMNILEKIESMKEYINKVQYVGYIQDMQTLDTLRKYIRTKIRAGGGLKDGRRKTILKSVVVISQKMALYRRLSVNQSHSDFLALYDK